MEVEPATADGATVVTVAVVLVAAFELLVLPAPKVNVFCEGAEELNVKLNPVIGADVVEVC